MRPTDTTNLRSAAARSRIMHASPEVTVGLHDLEAALTELDELRRWKAKMPSVLEAPFTGAGQPAGDPYVALAAKLDSQDTQPPLLPAGHFPMSQERMMGFLNMAYACLQMGPQSIALPDVESHLACVLFNMRIRYEARERDWSIEKKERDSLKQENLELRSRTVFPKAALAADLAKVLRDYYGPDPARDPEAPEIIINALLAYEQEDAEYPFVPADCDVRRIMLWPSGPGEGEEVYAENIGEVEARLTKLSEELEESQLKVREEKTRLEWLFTHCVAVGMGAPPAGVTEAGMTLEGRICAFTQGLIEDVGNYKLRGDILERDARRWRAFRGSARIRVLGSAGLTSDSQAAKDNPGYAHLGLEIWTKYPGDHAKENALGRDWLTTYADIALGGGLDKTP